MLELSNNYVHRYKELKHVYCICKPNIKPAKRQYYSVPYKKCDNVLVAFANYDMCYGYVRNCNRVETLDIASFLDLASKMSMNSVVILKFNKEQKYELLYKPFKT